MSSIEGNGSVSEETKNDLAWLTGFVKGDASEEHHLEDFQCRLKAGESEVHDLRVFWDIEHEEHARYVMHQRWLRAAVAQIEQWNEISVRSLEVDQTIKQGPLATAALYGRWSSTPTASCVTPLMEPRTDGGVTTGPGFPSGGHKKASAKAGDKVASNRQRSEAHGRCSASATKPVEPEASGHGESSWNGDESIGGPAFHRKGPPSRYVPE